MYSLKIPSGYKSEMTLRETERAIKLIKDAFEEKLAASLNLERISAPLFVRSDSGINDDLNGTERPVSFSIGAIDDTEAVIIHSLAKWKRIALGKYGYGLGEGIYTDMNAIRRDDVVDNIHSLYVDQWDWELVISKEQRTAYFLKQAVMKIAGAVADTAQVVKADFPYIDVKISREVFFITAQELEDMYPDKTPKEREYEITKDKKTVFLMNIGDVLNSGIKHDGRAPDYDDWTLNGDLIFWNDVLGEQLEISSMGVRVDAASLKLQLAKTGDLDRLRFDYHKSVINNTLPLTIGGGIGQSRLCMLLLRKMHIGETQVSLWPDEMLNECNKSGINIL